MHISLLLCRGLLGSHTSFTHPPRRIVQCIMYSVSSKIAIIHGVSGRISASTQGASISGCHHRVILRIIPADRMRHGSHRKILLLRGPAVLVLLLGRTGPGP